MIAGLKALSEAAQICLGAVAGILIGWAATFAYASFVIVPAERQAAVTEERLAFADMQRRAARKADEDRRTSQAEIDRAETENLARERIRDAEMAALDAALQEEKNDAKPVVAGAPAACRPAVPRRLSIALDRLGRTASGQRSPVADGALP